MCSSDLAVWLGNAGGKVAGRGVQQHGKGVAHLGALLLLHGQGHLLGLHGLRGLRLIQPRGRARRVLRLRE